MITLADYVGFIKKIMKLMQLTYPMFRKIEVITFIVDMINFFKYISNIYGTNYDNDQNHL